MAITKILPDVLPENIKNKFFAFPRFIAPYKPSRSMCYRCIYKRSINTIPFCYKGHWHGKYNESVLSVNTFCIGGKSI